MAAQGTTRPRITLRGREIQHNGERAKVVFRLGRISVGCTDVDTNAAEFLLAEYRKAFPPNEQEVVLQDIRPDATQFYQEQQKDKTVAVFVNRVMDTFRFGFNEEEGRAVLRASFEHLYEMGRASCTD